MRRIVAPLLVALVAPLVGLTLLVQAGPVTLARTVLWALDAVAPRAAAQSTLQFKPVPAESTSALENEPERESSTDAEPVPSVPPVPPAPPAPTVIRAGDLARFGNDIHVQPGEVVRGDITAMGGTVTVDGTVHGDIAAIGGDVYLNSTARVEGDVVSVGGTVHEQPGAFVSGKTMTVAGGGPFGRHVRIGGWDDDRPDWRAHGLWAPFRVARALVKFMLAILFTLLIVWLFPSRIVRGVETVRRNPATSLGIGALVYALLIPSLIALVIVVALLCITIIGIPLALAALLGYCLFFVVFGLFGLVIGATLVGEWVAGRRGVGGLPLWQTALTGVLLIGGTRLVGRLFHLVPGFHWFGTLLIALTILVMIVLGTIGGGAWLKWEFGEGLFGRWRGRWENRRPPAGPGSSYGPPPGSPYGPSAPTEPPVPPSPSSPPPLPSSSPESYMPPPTQGP
jgi:hypothetical protein